jgi:chromosome segregation ATPase
LAAVEAENEALKQTATENTRYYAGLLNEAGANLGTLKKDLAERDAEIQQLKKDLAAVAVDRNVEKSLKKQLDSMPTENHQDYDQLLESSSTTIDNQRKVVALLQSRLRKEREEREKLEAQLAELEQNPTTASKDLPEAADLLKNLRKSNGKKSTASLADVEKILEILGGSNDPMD